MNFNLKSRVGWGNSIHLETFKRCYSGSGRGYDLSGSKAFLMSRVKPDYEEFYKDGWPTEVKISGHCLGISTGDTIEYEYQTDCLPTDTRLIVNGFKLKVTSIRFENDPRDQFFGKAILVESCGHVVKQGNIINRLKRWWKSF